jgi:hypothetical protein
MAVQDEPFPGTAAWARLSKPGRTKALARPQRAVRKKTKNMVKSGKAKGPR